MPTTEELREALLELMVLEPCHVTGMHDPNHTDTHLCGIQKERLVDNLLAAVGIEVGELRHKLHDNCGWCHNIPSQEEYREKMRRVHKWAGEPIPKALAAPAIDAERPGDAKKALAVMPEHWEAFGDVRERSGIAYGYRFTYAVDKLVKQGLVEERTKNHHGEVRLARKGK